MRSPEALRVEDRIRLTWALYEMFGAFEFMHDQARERTLPATVWLRWLSTIAWWVSLPGVQAWWQAKPTPFSRRFSALIDGLIARPAVDASAVARWQGFLRPESAVVDRAETGANQTFDRPLP